MVPYFEIPNNFNELRFSGSSTSLYLFNVYQVKVGFAYFATLVVREINSDINAN